MPNLPSTVGIWLVTAFVEALLQGMGMLQGFLYFTWYHKDPWSVKATVALLLALESLQMGASIANVYEWFVAGFGDFDNLDVIHWQDMLQLTALYCSMFITQAWVVAILWVPINTGPSSLTLVTTTPVDKKNIVLPLLIFVLSLLALSSGIGEVIAVQKYSSLDVTSVTNVLQTAAALAADMLITFGLCWRLRKCRSEFQSTNKILNFVILTAINRSVFTMFFAVLNMILFLTRPGTFAFMIALFVSDKLYMNSLLAMLNTREYAVQVSGAALAEHITMPNFASVTNSRSKPATVYIQTTTEVRNDVGGRFGLESVKTDSDAV
ncbi:hypothetical protein GGX14DRAFT_594488 [Mycena pura]|uniref:DUF6534 domain-containing protein n=1 Tax=Mycena pura TaxID=153505 RepID=A0AAD6USG2_9AGAR|nr:hypothetical protein GGX14DRAFT_594488 [Mycena pura]